MDFDALLEELDRNGLARTPPVIAGAQGRSVEIAGRRVLLFCSNDYLGLASHRALKEAAAGALERYGAGAGASRLVSGTMELHARLEERIAAFKGAEAAMLFNSGYHANLGLLQALAGRDDEVFCDRLDHASIFDGVVLSRARLRRYPHRDMEALEAALRRSKARRRLIVTDGVFSMDGTIAPLDEIVALAERYDALVIVDDAHATGVIGPGGRGTAELFSVESPRLVEMGTLGKALGSFGAYAAGPRPLVEYLRNRARSYIYTTALPPAQCAASMAAIDLVEKDDGPRKRLAANTALLRGLLAAAGLAPPGDGTPIVPVVTGSNESAVAASRALLEEGFFVQAIRPPTVPQGLARLRITLSALHEASDIERLAAALTGVVERLPS
ncbi:MAG TPA: 8-amino-7-oxononanoate synthase [Deltaproteobacteria bacterium]|nr:8-amino-7-oxononanoate synthase [Deltaproteobacteria bacterium]